MGLYENLCGILGEGNVLKDEPMKNHTTFRVGGPADWFVTPKEDEQVREIINVLRKEKIPYYVVGNGSNLLVGDKGYRGVIIQLYKRMSQIQVTENTVYAQAGALLSRIAAEVLTHGLAGLEFASGIPGTLGGAVMMNAGAYGSELADVLGQVRIFDPEKGVQKIPATELELGYRTSNIPTRGLVVLGAEFCLKPGKATAIGDRMEELTAKRKAKQPLEYPSAGSTFKRPKGAYASALIDGCGLKGRRVGGAMVSEKHAGFVINYDNASCTDVLTLIGEIQTQVREQTGFSLECEVKYIG